MGRRGMVEHGDVRRGTARCTDVEVPCSTANFTMPPTPILPATALPASASSTPLTTPRPTPPSTPGPVPPSPAGGKKRGTGFTSEEDVLLTKAWVRVSEDAIVGSEQKGEVFYKSINDYYDSKRPPHCAQRSVKSTVTGLLAILV